MRLAISNIAWDTANDEAMVALLHRHAVDAIDIAPSKYFPRVAEARSSEVIAVQAWWADRGIEITGMQALLFGTTNLNVFGEPAVQRVLLDHLEQVCRIGGILGAPRLVFGSPRNRDRGGLADEETMDIAVRFFRRLGDIAAAQGVFVCLEPNPTRYGANFMTHSAETATVVRAVSHPAIRMQFDAGSLTMNREEPMHVLADSADLIGHVHASEPELLPLGDGGTDHSAMAAALRLYLPASTVCIEMLAAKDEAPLVSVERALAAAVLHYRC